ncbi:MAG TPA: hypothetical protein VFA86_09875 [Gammaproteobacteria bacterium]|nr:hypothetical protein [Gammaproteobacteria bacterium]
MKLRYLICAAALVMPFAAQAQGMNSASNGFSYNYVDLGYTRARFTTPRYTNPGAFSNSGYTVRASWLFLPNYFVKIGYQTAKWDHGVGTPPNTSAFKHTYADLGIGARYGLARTLDAVASVSALYEKVNDNAGTNKNNTGERVTAGFRIHPSARSHFELDTLLRYNWVKRGNTAYQHQLFRGDYMAVIGRAMYSFTRNVAVMVEYQNLDNADFAWTGGFRVSF